MTWIGFLLMVGMVIFWISVESLSRGYDNNRKNELAAFYRMQQRSTYERKVKYEGYKGTFDDYMAEYTGRKDWWNSPIYGGTKGDRY